MRWVLGLLVILGLGLGTTWLLDPGTSTPLPPNGGIGTHNASGTTGFEAANGNETVAASGDLVGDHANGARPQLTREDRTPRDTAPPGPYLLVVQGDPAVPVANAQVFFLDESKYRRRRNAQTQPVSRFEAPERDGMRSRTDQRGMVQLPGGSGRWLCSALTGDSFGFLVVTKKPGQHTITLGPDEQVVIVAHHSGDAGQTVKDMPLVVVQQHKTSSTKELWRGRTDERGRAVLRHFQMMRQSRRSDQPKEFRERFAAVLRIPTTPIVLAEFPGRPTTDDEVHIHVPPLGTVQVQLVDHSGRPLLTPARIGISTIGSAPKTFPIRSGTFSQTANKPVGTAPVTMPYAQVGRDVRLYARYAHDRRSAYSETTEGPKEPGQCVGIKIAPLARHCVFAGRFLHNGQALKSGSVSITIWRDDVIASTAGAQTVASGLWDLVMSARSEKARWRMEFRYQQLALEGATETEPPANKWFGAILDFPGYQPGTRHEFGDIVLGELPPLAAGIVVDDAGEPIAGASVSIQQERAARTRTSRSLSSGFALFESNEILISWLNTNDRSLSGFNGRSGARSGTPSYRSLRHLRTKTQANGTFAIYGSMPTGKLRVLADGSEHFSAHVLLPAPSRNLRLVLPRSGFLRGKVLLPEWLPQRSIKIKLRPHEESRRRRETVSTRVAESPGHPFVLQPLRPGRYDLLVEMRNISAPMTIIGDVFIKPGDNQDARTQAIDLRHALFRYHLEARDEAGRPFPLDGPIHARFAQPDGTFVEAGFRWQKGKAELITPHSTAELTFFGRGFVPLQQQYGPGNHDVFLTTQKPALVNVPGARALSGPTRKIRISAILQGDTGLPASLSGIDQKSGRSFSFSRWDLGRSSGGWLEHSDLIEIPLMKAGKYQLLFRAHATESTRSPQTSVSLGTFDLTVDGSIVTVPLNAQQITSALNKIDKQWQARLKRNKSRNR